MKKIKTIRRILIAGICILLLSVSVPASLGTQTGLVTTAQAAARLSSTKKTLAVGQTSKLKVSGVSNSAKVKWTSSNSKIVKVSKSGKIRAMKPGKATITAKVTGRKLYCTVKVIKNQLNFSTSSSPRKTGFYDVGQSGNLIPSIEVQPVLIKYTASGALKIKYKLYNYSSSWKWTSINRLRDVYIETKNGTPLVDIDPFDCTNAFSLYPGETKYLTLTLKGSYVKKVVNLPKAGGIRYSIDIYLKDAWH